MSPRKPPPDGTAVRARLWRWKDVQKNNELDSPNPALPSYEGMEEWVEGRLKHRTVDAPEAKIHYEQYVVNGQEVDPKSIVRIKDADLHAPAKKGLPVVRLEGPAPGPVVGGEYQVKAYNPDEPRDEHGRWGDGSTVTPSRHLQIGDRVGFIQRWQDSIAELDRLVQGDPEEYRRRLEGEAAEAAQEARAAYQSDQRDREEASRALLQAAHAQAQDLPGGPWKADAEAVRSAGDNRPSPFVNPATIDAFAEDTYQGTFAGLHTKVEAAYQLTPSVFEVLGRITQEDGTKVGTFTRRLYDNGRVEHHFMSIQPQVQGGGFARAFNAHAEENYKAAGFSHITVHADIDVGGFAWAHQGYDWDPAEPHAGVEYRVMRAGDNYMPPPTPEEREANLAGQPLPWVADLEQLQNDVKVGKVSPADIANFGKGKYEWKTEEGKTTWPGKQIMLGSDWYGVKKLVDAPIS